MAKKCVFIGERTENSRIRRLEKLRGGVRVDSKASDSRIIELYFERAELAIAKTEEKYGKYCHTIAYNILFSHEDADECVNDTYLRVWNTIPPNRPSNLKAFLAKITRNLALDKYWSKNAQKRSCGIDVAMDELSECLSDGSEGNISDELAMKEVVNSFLASLNPNVRIIFLQRYWYFCPIKEIASNLGVSENTVKVTLSRTRSKFKEYLKKEDITV